MKLALPSLLALAVAAEPAPKAASRCWSTYNPVGIGTEWEYRGEMRSTDPRGQGSVSRSESRQRVVALESDSMRLQSASTHVTQGQTFPSTNTMDYTCGDDGPVMVADRSSGQRTLYRGSIAPRLAEPGSRWDYSVDMVDVKGRGIRSVRHHEIVGTERVVVPAGTFDALKVAWEQETIRVDPDPKELEKWQKVDRVNQTTMKGFEWYAPQVGLVRRSFETVSLFKGKPDSRAEGTDELVVFRP